MAKKNKKSPTKITKEQLHKMDKAARRQAMLNAGIKTLPPNKVEKSAKAYTRKPKYKKPPEDEAS